MAKFTKTVTETVNCPYCASEGVIKWGKQKGNQRYRCKGCEKSFITTGALHGRRVSSEQIGAAIRMFYSGMSYKQIGENMADMFDMPEPSKQTIYAWVKEYTDLADDQMEDYKAKTGKHWVADESSVDVGGELMWNWNVMDEDTRYILASHLSPHRNKKAAVATMEKAKLAASESPETIKTDHLSAYGDAIEEVFPKTRHVQSKGMQSPVLNNNLSERLQGTYRQRTKTLRGLESLETGQRYLDGWTLTYNLFREHEGLDYKTPGKVAKVNAPYSEWADVVKGGATPTVVVDETKLRRSDLNEKDIEMKSSKNLVFVSSSKRPPQRFDVPPSPINPAKPKKPRKRKTARHPYAKKGERI
ncbi:MAG: IS6 family transposase [Dehalococcoidia bacterium]|nr:IS6 family transposase [Dehalococcoidia bacterium]